MSTPTPPDFFDTDGRPDSAAAQGERKLKVWAVLNAVSQGLMNADEACAAYAVSPAELELHRAEWQNFETGQR